jgi:hydrogenase nickel incorporation protein HypA/HybF
VHELSLSSAILATTLRHADGRRVTAVDLTVGALRQVVVSSLEFYFEVVSRDTLCEGARLEVTEVEARLGCRSCAGEPWTLDVPVFRCPSCGGSEVEVLSGNEFLVDSIDVEEEAEASCTVQR